MDQNGFDADDDGSDTERHSFWRGVLYGGAPVLLLFALAFLLGVRGLQVEYAGFAQKLGSMFFWAAIAWSLVGAIAAIALYGRFMGAMATGVLVSLGVAWVATVGLYVVG